MAGCREYIWSAHGLVRIRFKFDRWRNNPSMRLVTSQVGDSENNQEEKEWSIFVFWKEQLTMHGVQYLTSQHSIGQEEGQKMPARLLIWQRGKDIVGFVQSSVKERGRWRDKFDTTRSLGYSSIIIQLQQQIRNKVKGITAANRDLRSST